MRVFNIDISRKGISPVVQVTEYDAMSRFFTLVLRNGSSDYEPPENPTYSVWYKTKDSHGWYDTITLPDESTRPAVVADGNAYTVEIAEPATTSCGELALCITAPGGYQLTISGIITRSDDIPGYDGSEVENYYNVYITRMQENAARAENAADIAVAYGATVEVDEDAQQLNITHHSDTEGGVGWLFGSAVASSAEGSVAAFADGANDVAVKSLVAEITPVQSGTGDPSPTNIRPISGRTGLTVTRCGKNLLPNSIQASTASGVTFTIDNGRVIANGTASATITLIISTSCALAPGNYILTGCPAGGGSSAHYKIDIVRNGESSRKIDTGSGTTFAVGTAGLYTARIVIYSGEVCNNLTFAPMVRLSGESADYAPYNGAEYPITWETEAGTIYGGTLNVTTGVLTVDMAIIDMGDMTWNYSSNDYFYSLSIRDAVLAPSASDIVTTAICSLYKPVITGQIISHSVDNAFGIIPANDTNHGRVCVRDTSKGTSAADFKTAVTGQKIVYPLATPLDPIQLSPTEVKTLLGGNTIYTDAGSVSVDYVADTKLYIDNKVAELQALILEN